MADEGKPNTLGNMVDGLPWWLKAGLVIYNTAGLPTALLVFYMLQNIGVIPNPVEQRMEGVEGKLEEVAGLTVQGNAAMKHITDQLAKSEERRKMYCVLRAKDEAEKKACFSDLK